LNIARLRDEACDRMIRELALRKKERVERDRRRDLEQAKRDADERRMQQLKKASTPKKREREEERPLAIGAHGVARQDGRDGSGSRMGKFTRSR
jgi:transcriptional adapter 3